MNFYIFVVSVLLVGGISLFSLQNNNRRVRRRPLSRIGAIEKHSIAETEALNASYSEAGPESLRRKAGTLHPPLSCRRPGSQENAGKQCSTSETCPADHFCESKRLERQGHCKPMCSSEKIVRNATFLPREGDTWIVSYPKSGSTWLRHIITNLFHYHRHFRNGTSVVDESATVPSPASFADVDEFIPFLEDKTFGSPYTRFLAQPEPRIFKSHQPYNCDDAPCKKFINHQARWQCLCPNCASKFRRIIYIVRDGRAVMSSYYQFRQELGHVRKGKSFDSWLRKKSHYPGPTWADHVLSWWERKDHFLEKDFLWIKYENIIKSPEDIVRKLSQFFNLSQVDEEIVRLTVKASSRETMMKLEGEKGSGFFEKRYKRKSRTFKMVHNKSSWQERFYGKDWQKRIDQPEFAGSVKKHGETDEDGVGDKENHELKTPIGFFNAHNRAVMECMGYYL